MFDRIQDVAPGAVNTYSAKSALFTAGASNRGTFYDCTGSFTITLDTTSMMAGWSAYFRCISGTQTFDPTGSVTINGAATYAVSNAGDIVLVVFDGTNFVLQHTQIPSTVAITGGTINGTVIGGTTAAAGSFTTGSFTGAVTLTTASSGLAISKTTGTTLVVSSTDASTSPTTGSSTFAGGIGVAGAGYFGGTTLEVQTAAANTTCLLRMKNTDTTMSVDQSYGNIEWDGSDASSGANGVRGKIALLERTGGGATDMVFYNTVAGDTTLNERVRISSAGYVGIGLAPVATWTDSASTPLLQAASILNSTAGAGFAYFGSTTTNASRLILARSRGTTIGDYTVVLDGDSLGNIFASGADGTDLSDAASIRFKVDGTPGAGDIPGSIELRTKPAGSALATAFIIDSTGRSAASTGTNSAAKFYITNSVLTGTTQIGAYSNFTGTSTGTASLIGFEADLTSAAASYTLSRMIGFLCGTQALGASSTITRFMGAHVTRSVIATNNAAYHHKSTATATFTGNWCLYNDTADSNYFGTGNALVNDPTARAGITGTTAVTPILQVNGNSAATSYAALNRWDTAAGGAGLSLALSKGSAIGTHTVVSSNNVLGTITFAGSDGTGFIEAARIEGVVDGTPGTTDMPGRLVFYTTPDGSGTGAERLRIDNVGTITATVTDSATSSASTALTLYHASSGTPAAGFGSSIFLNAQSTTSNRNIGRIDYTWVVATDASRTGRISTFAYDTSARECLRCEASGSAAMIGFLGASAVVRHATTGESTGFTAGAGTTVTHLSTFTGNTGSTAYTIADIVKCLKNCGLMTT